MLTVSVTNCRRANLKNYSELGGAFGDGCAYGMGEHSPRGVLRESYYFSIADWCTIRHAAAPRDARP